MPEGCVATTSGESEQTPGWCGGWQCFDDLATSGLEGGIKGKGAVTEVLEAMTLGPSGRERQHGIEPVEGLDGALFVHAEEGSMGRRGQIESDDIGGFRFESCISGSHEVT